MSRRKGGVGEREVVALLRQHGWGRAERTSNGRAQAGKGDIAGGPEGVHIEVKRVEKLNVSKALAQIDRDAGPHDLPLLLHRSSNQPWLATLPAEELLALLRLREA